MRSCCTQWPRPLNLNRWRCWTRSFDDMDAEVAAAMGSDSDSDDDDEEDDNEDGSGGSIIKADDDDVNEDADLSASRREGKRKRGDEGARGLPGLVPAVVCSQTSLDSLPPPAMDQPGEPACCAEEQCAGMLTYTLSAVCWPAARRCCGGQFRGGDRRPNCACSGGCSRPKDCRRGVSKRRQLG